MVDTGMWLLSERAVRALMVRSGWDLDRQRFGAGTAGTYELYGEFGLALGTRPTVADPLVSDLTSAVVPLPRPEFYHFGTSRQMIESVSALQNRELDDAVGAVGKLIELEHGHTIRRRLRTAPGAGRSAGRLPPGIKARANTAARYDSIPRLTS